jgi:uncharacterized protein YbbC (DUF1343 family)
MHGAKRIRFGADRLAADPALLGAARRVGLATNDAARTSLRAGRTTRAALQAAGVPLVRLFSPEHGLGAAAPDGTAVGDAPDPVTGLPVTSLYGERVAPPPAVLAELDGVLFDVPDIGARCYTYIWTLTYLIDSCADAGLPLWVLDRPNPLGGAAGSVEGPLLEPEHASFVGRHTVPVRHALTTGELALLWQRERRPDADVRVVACEGWARQQPWHDTGLAFVPPSPAITTADAALLYPGLAFLEATNVSVGRGSPLSFRAAGAPWLRVGALLERLATRPLPGLAAAPDRFVPAIGPHAGNACAAVRLDVVEPMRVRPVTTGLALLADIAALHLAEFGWRTYPTVVNPGGAGHLERLVGSTAVCSVLRRTPAAATDAVIAGWVAAPGWAERWRSVQLYP